MIADSYRYDPDEQPASVPTPSPSTLVFDRQSVRAIDRAAIEEYGVPGIVLMENAARGLLREALAMLAQSPRSTPHALIICGSGNNGGDGYALARGLHNAGVQVTLAALKEPSPQSDAGINFAICKRLGLPLVELDDLSEFDRKAQPDLIVDAIFGTGLDRPVTGTALELINWINSRRRPVLAVDVPSGMDCDTGQPVGDGIGPVVRATKTVTFVGLKPGFLELDAQRWLGEVVVVDIGAPIELLEKLGRRVALPHPEPPEHPELDESLAYEPPLYNR